MSALDKALNHSKNIGINECEIVIVKKKITTVRITDSEIAEIKQNKYKANSAFIQIIRDMKIPEMRFSKYCMGMLHVNKDLKYNQFKPKLMQINKILQSELI